MEQRVFAFLQRWLGPPPQASAEPPAQTFGQKLKARASNTPLEATWLPRRD
jgi:hypothetical protein